MFFCILLTSKITKNRKKLFTAFSQNAVFDDTVFLFDRAALMHIIYVEHTAIIPLGQEVLLTEY